VTFVRDVTFRIRAMIFKRFFNLGSELVAFWLWNFVCVIWLLSLFEWVFCAVLTDSMCWGASWYSRYQHLGRFQPI